MSERYKYDAGMCSVSKGWAQIDSSQDASYYGQWANPLTLEYFCYCEGDTTHKKADSPEEFREFMLELAKWGEERGYGFKIDGMRVSEIIEAFKNLGLGEYLH